MTTSSQASRCLCAGLLLFAHCRDSSGSRSDASAEPRFDAARGADASSPPPDTALQDASSGVLDAGAGAVATLRSQICGDMSTWPAPLPATTELRKAEPVGDQSFGFLEGPVWISEHGVLLFSDMNFDGAAASGPPARIRRLTPPATFDEFTASSNGNGLALDAERNLIAATHDNQGLSNFDLTSGARTRLDLRVDGKHLNSPNDLCVRDDGTIYLTDPDWQLGSRASETNITGVYRVDPPLRKGMTHRAVLVDGTLDKPNGIALSPDQRTLYVGSLGPEIWKYDVAEDGSLSARTKFADTGSSDGFAIDCAGNLYVTSDTVEVFSPAGEKLGDISIGDSPTNAAFGGDDHKTLYITAGPRLYAIRLNVPGFPY
jgi:gluconolactonase